MLPTRAASWVDTSPWILPHPDPCPAHNADADGDALTRSNPLAEEGLVRRLPARRPIQSNLYCSAHLRIFSASRYEDAW